MAITVNWPTGVIHIPKADLTLIQSSPTEIRELDLNWFRLILKDLEDDLEGITWTKTHTHNTEVSLGGVTFARVVEILDPYTITFEDLQYAVNLTGANSNIGDKVNVNQVSVRSSNSAGLISSPDIEYASFNGAVTVDAFSGITGTIFPRGTERMKVNNIADALLIANYRGFNKLYIHSDMQINNDSNLNNFVLEGQSDVNTQIDILSSADVENIKIVNCDVTGTLDGGTELNSCVIRDLNYMNGHIHNCSLAGTITLAGGVYSYLLNCTILDVLNPPTIDMGVSGQNLLMPNYTGQVKIINMNGLNRVGAALNNGQVVLDSTTVKSGMVSVIGIGKLMDEFGNEILTGVWNGGVMIVNETLNPDSIGRGVWNNNTATQLIADMETTKQITVGRWKIDIVANTMTYYDSDNITPLYTFNLKDSTGFASTTNVFERVPQ